MKDPFDQPSDPSAIVKTMEVALNAGLLRPIGLADAVAVTKRRHSDRKPS